MRLLEFIGSALSTLLPPRYLKGTRLSGPAIFCGAVQIVLSVFLLVFRFFWLVEHGGELLDRGNATDHFVEFGGLYVQANMVAGLANFWLNPINAFLVYLVIEGTFRIMAAMATGEVIGTLPFYVVSGVHGLWEKSAKKRELGELIVDRVVRGGERDGCDLKILSCRPKSNWNPYMTIEFEETFYQMFKEEKGNSPHRFVYYLRKNPTGLIVVVVDHYRIDNVLKPAQDKWAGTPKTLDNLRSKVDQGALVPDLVERGTGRQQDFDLKIYRCRAQKNWNAQVTIEFENVWYQVFKDERGTKPRPYIYYLRRWTTDRPSVTLRRYSVDDVMKEPN